MINAMLQLHVSFVRKTDGGGMEVEAWTLEKRQMFPALPRDGERIEFVEDELMFQVQSVVYRPDKGDVLLLKQITVGPFIHRVDNPPEREEALECVTRWETEAGFALAKHHPPKTTIEAKHD
jgi:hypothetical protein